MSLEDLISQVAGRMQELVPEGFRIEHTSEMLWYHYDLESAYGGGPTGSYFRQFLELGDSEPVLTADRVRDACELAFDQLQDFVDEVTSVPWPGGREVPSVSSKIEGNKVHVWFGSFREPDLDCGFIDLP
jgi:hypothetical protein